MPTQLAHDLREFQIHQFADNRMELRFVARSAPPDAFFEKHSRAEWAKVADQGEPELAWRRGSNPRIPRSPGGKTEVFYVGFHAVAK